MGEVEKRHWERASDDAWCSFCRKNWREVGPLAEGPDYVYICYDCIRRCTDIIVKERERLDALLKEPFKEESSSGSSGPEA